MSKVLSLDLRASVLAAIAGRLSDNLRQRTKPGERAARCVRGEGRVRVCSHHVQTREALNDAAKSVRRAPRAGVAALFAESDAESQAHVSAFRAQSCGRLPRLGRAVFAPPPPSAASRCRREPPR